MKKFITIFLLLALLLSALCSCSILFGNGDETDGSAESQSAEEKGDAAPDSKDTSEQGTESDTKTQEDSEAESVSDTETESDTQSDKGAYETDGKWTPYL